MTRPDGTAPTWAVVVLLLTLVVVLAVVAVVGARRDAGVLFFLALTACSTSLQIGVWLGHRQARGAPRP